MCRRRVLPWTGDRVARVVDGTLGICRAEGDKGERGGAFVQRQCFAIPDDDDEANFFSLPLSVLFFSFSFVKSSKVELPGKAMLTGLAANALIALPSFAGEPGKIFDFNLTLPIIATEFLLLMVILDKTVFGPVGKAIDDRDELIRNQLASVGDNSTAVADLIVSFCFFLSSRIFSNTTAKTRPCCGVCSVSNPARAGQV